MLEVERHFFESNRTEWLETAVGKYALVKNEELFGFFENASEALAEGARRFGSESFLVRLVEESEQLIYVPALTLGILRADTAHSV